MLTKKVEAVADAAKGIANSQFAASLPNSVDSTVHRAFDSIDNLSSAPLKMLENWLYEPLKRSEHDRQVRDKKLEVELQVQRARDMDDLKIRLQEKDIAYKQALADMKVELDRKTLENLQEYSKKMLEDIASINDSIGSMSIALQEKAVKLLDEQEAKYVAVNKQINQDCFEQLQQYKELLSDDSDLYIFAMKDIITQKGQMLSVTKGIIETIRDSFAQITAWNTEMAKSTQEAVHKRLDAVTNNQHIPDYGGPNVYEGSYTVNSTSDKEPKKIEQ